PTGSWTAPRPGAPWAPQRNGGRPARSSPPWGCSPRMRVVVAGSSGLIGTALVAPLRRAGHDVVRLVRRRPAATDERGWDPPAGRRDDGALDDTRPVVNLCGGHPGGERWGGGVKQGTPNATETATPQA